MDDEVEYLEESLTGNFLDLSDDDKEALEAALEVMFVGMPGMGSAVGSHLKETFNVYRTVYIKQRDTYYHNHWGYQPKNIPPKHATCSSRRRGRPCKKRK